MKPCASCPFLPHNHKEFGVVAAKLCLKHGRPKPDFWACLSIRKSVVDEAKATGRLLCHCHVYDKGMNADPRGARPCAGLMLWLKDHSSLPSLPSVQSNGLEQKEQAKEAKESKRAGMPAVRGGV